jgi:hypothetical protein
MQRFVDQRRGADGNLVDVTVDDQTGDPRRFRERRDRHDPGRRGRAPATSAISGSRSSARAARWRSAGSVPTSCTSSTAAEPQDRQGYRTIFVGPAHPGADGIHTVAAQGLGYTDAFTIAARNTLRNLAAGKVLSGPSFVDGMRVAEVTDAVIAAVASGSSEAVVRRDV